MGKKAKKQPLLEQVVSAYYDSEQEHSDYDKLERQLLEKVKGSHPNWDDILVDITKLEIIRTRNDGNYDGFSSPVKYLADNEEKLRRALSSWMETINNEPWGLELEVKGERMLDGLLE